MTDRMDAQSRKTKLAELETWQRNLATKEAQAAGYGMTPPVDVVNEIETARRNIARVKAELDAGVEQSTEATLTGILELSTWNSQTLTRHGDRLDAMDRKLAKLDRRANPTTTATVSRLASIIIVVVLYTSAVIKEIRDAMIGNLFSTALIVFFALLTALLLWLFSRIMQPQEVIDDDR